ncbi:Ca2+-binding RTX toxin-like protein [Shinella sp. BE166]|uniref:M10 family metallopeptidase C-terminal domain-containing protein n=1 Tax=Shinella sp. BE166 TaxID=3373918 RepID=UPI003EB99647
MTKLIVHEDYRLNMRNLDYTGLFTGAGYILTDTMLRFFYPDGSIELFRGFGFGTDGSGNPTKGFVRSYALIVDGDRALSLDGLDLKMSEIIRAALTFSAVDDRRLVEKMFSGNDIIKGGDLDDVIRGHKGNDKITGGVGADALYGGLGSDMFVFRSIEDSSVEPFGRDKIYDFSPFQKDRIDLRSIDANSDKSGNQKFQFIGDDQFNQKAGELRYQKKGSDTLIYGDLDGDGNADFSIALDTALILKSADFIL